MNKKFMQIKIWKLFNLPPKMEKGSQYSGTNFAIKPLAINSWAY
jgi:hypothetical protein